MELFEISSLLKKIGVIWILVPSRIMPIPFLKYDLVRIPCIRNRAINACLAPIYSVEGMHVVTVEGIGNRRFGLHRVQVC